MSAVLDLHADLVRFPALSHEEEVIADFVEAHARRVGGPHGVRVGREENNVWAALGDGDDVLLLASHLDVVPASEGHPYSPFVPTLVDGKIYGRGTVDAKASGAAMLQALLDLAAEGFRPEGGQLIVALTACEESGGTYNGMQHLRPHLPEIRAALVGEPTELIPCLAQKGLLILKLHARGKSAHAARAHLGLNAIEVMMRDLAALRELRFPEDPFVGPVTVTPTRIEAGSASNVVPDRCTATLDIRTTADTPHPWLAEQVAAAVESEVEVYSQRFVPCRTAPDARIAQACAAALPGEEPFGSPTASDWVFLADVPAVKLGPGRSQLSHTADEHVAAAEVERAVAVYQAVARAVFSGWRAGRMDGWTISAPPLPFRPLHPSILPATPHDLVQIRRLLPRRLGRPLHRRRRLALGPAALAV